MLNSSLDDYPLNTIYLEPPIVEVISVPGIDDKVNSLGIKGVGGLGIVGTATALLDQPALLSAG